MIIYPTIYLYIKLSIFPSYYLFIYLGAQPLDRERTAKYILEVMASDGAHSVQTQVKIEKI